MTQIKRVERFSPYQFKVGDRVTCEFYPDTVWTIKAVKGKSAVIFGPGKTERDVKLSRLRKA